MASQWAASRPASTRQDGSALARPEPEGHNQLKPLLAPVRGHPMALVHLPTQRHLPPTKAPGNWAAPAAVCLAARHWLPANEIRSKLHTDPAGTQLTRFDWRRRAPAFGPVALVPEGRPNCRRRRPELHAKWAHAKRLLVRLHFSRPRPARLEVDPTADFGLDAHGRPY